MKHVYSVSRYNIHCYIGYVNLGILDLINSDAFGDRQKQQASKGGCRFYVMFTDGHSGPVCYEGKE